MALLEVEELVVRYGAVMALDRVSIEVGEGEIVALVGANGAGKSTLIRTIVGQVGPDAGTVHFLGRPLEKLASWQRARRGIGLSPEGRRIFPGLTVRENLEVAADCGARDAGRRIAEIFDLFPALRGSGGVLGWQLSGGQQQMLAVGRALASNPRLLLLDEPSLGLAPNAVHELLRTVRRAAAGGRSVLLAEQNAAAAFDVADRVYVLQNGRVAGQGRPDDLRDNSVVPAAFLG
jgi:branched-chain amino acid transport system ATP-binding protein